MRVFIPDPACGDERRASEREHDGPRVFWSGSHCRRHARPGDGCVAACFGCFHVGICMCVGDPGHLSDWLLSM